MPDLKKRERILVNSMALYLVAIVDRTTSSNFVDYANKQLVKFWEKFPRLTNVVVMRSSELISKSSPSGE